ncbi:hypothetical protein MLD38_011768 [Melastoma candidum]|uniref:Uncharacterized protein n=1 Tax=Melastoma candidum TaxID=119954 RepID=A0ACB9R3I8_9MYRT|nr:hypothetical protein MLD38_011768 [Melastoma candidum]
MAPKGGARKVVRTSCTTTRLRRKKQKKPPIFYKDCHPPSSDSVLLSVSPDRVPSTKEEEEEDNGGVCSTPKGDRYKIPETGTCPPAPKKNRPRCWSQGRRSYFASPEIEAFFLHALGGISV